MTLDEVLEWMKLHKATLKFYQDANEGLTMDLSIPGKVEPGSCQAFLDITPRLPLWLDLQVLVEHCEFLLEA